MLSLINKLNQLFEPEVFNSLKKTKFSKGTIVSSYSDKSILVVLQGEIHAVRHYDRSEYLAPYRFATGDIFGFYGNYIMKDSPWEFRASTDCEVLIIPKKVVEEVILNDFTLYKFFNEASAVIWNKIIKFLYIKFHGNSKSVFAFGLVEYSKDGRLDFLKIDNFIKMMNVSRTMFFKIEKEFVEKSLIKKERKSYILLDVEGLKKYYIDSLYLD